MHACIMFYVSHMLLHDRWTLNCSEGRLEVLAQAGKEAPPVMLIYLENLPNSMGAIMSCSLASSPLHHDKEH
jgi:hypothetical protein